MNHSRLKDILMQLANDLLGLGVPQYAVDDIVRYADNASVIAEASVRNNKQYALEFRRDGPSIIAERYGISRQAARKRYNKIIEQLNSIPLVAF